MQVAVKFLEGFPWPALGVVCALMLAELRWPARTERVRRMPNLAFWGVMVVFQRATMPLFMAGVSIWLTRLGVPSLHIDKWPLWLSLPLLVFVLDFCVYLGHRAMHEIPWLWERHALHHSDPALNATTTTTHWWGFIPIGSALIDVPVAVLLRPSGLDYLIYALIGNYIFFTHANLRVNFGRWSWALNSPAYHRLHHSRDPRYYGSNYANLFPIFDVILGTYRRPTEYVETGLDNEPRTLMQMLAWPPTKPGVRSRPFVQKTT